MYPVIFKIGSFEVMSFGVMVAIGALVGIWIFGRELRRAGLPHDAVNAAIYGVLAGILGAKLLFVFEHLGEDTLLSLFLNRGGLSWFGGLAAGIGTALAYFRWHRWPLIPILSAATPALAVGHLLGRIGCFLVGDDYGRPTSLPWGIAFPQGLPPTDVPVHPTQLYEAALLGILAWLLIRWRRSGAADSVVVGRYLMLTGLIRLAIEFVRINVRVALGLTVAQYGSVLLMLAGAFLLMRTSAPRKSS